MGYFIKKIGKYTLCILTSIFMFFYVSSEYCTSITYDEIFLGDSRINKHFDDPRNFGMGSESVYYTYYKINSIIKKNKTKRIFLAFNEHSIANYYTAASTDSKLIERYFEFLPADVQVSFALKLNYPKMIVERIDHFIKYNNTIIGEFQSPPIKKMLNFNTIEFTCKNHFNNGFSDLNISYFLKIVDLCKKNGIEIVIIKCPCHPWYKKNTPLAFRNRYFNLIRNLKQINMEDCLVEDKYYLPDGVHLNKEGQILFTHILNKILKNY